MGYLDELNTSYEDARENAEKKERITFARLKKEEHTTKESNDTKENE
jgi:hypothetical protein